MSPSVSPELPTNTTASGISMGEVLLDTHGKVARVWAIREVRFKPPFPPFNEAIVAAIKKWQFAPAIVNGDTTPICMTVTVNINLR